MVCWQGQHLLLFGAPILWKTDVQEKDERGAPGRGVSLSWTALLNRITYLTRTCIQFANNKWRLIKQA